MTRSVWCPINPTIATPLAGAEEAPDAPMIPNPAAISIAGTILRILLSSLTSPELASRQTPDFAND